MTYQLRRISDKEGYGSTPEVIIIKKQSTVIGRHSTKTPPDYVVESELHPMMVSRKHAEIRIENSNRYFLVDHSLNGTYINYTRILSSKLLLVGDLVCFGHVNGYNIKAGSTVMPFRSELKFIFEKISGVDAAGDTALSVFSGKSSMAENGNVSKKRKTTFNDLSSDGGSQENDLNKKKRRVSSTSSSSRDPSPISPSKSHTPESAKKSATLSTTKTSTGSSNKPKAAKKSKPPTTTNTSTTSSVTKSKPKMMKPPKSKSSRPSASASNQFHFEGDPCESLTCIKPKDPNVDWVCCDSCNAWYHVMCTDLDDDVNLEDVEFFCIKCRD